MKNKKTIKLFNWIFLLLGIFTIVSCASREQIVYFQGDMETIAREAEKYSPTIQPDDLLVITISARDFDATKPFNQVNYYYQNQNEMRLQTYLVDEEGYIEYPVLGKVKLGGLSRSQAIEELKKQLSEYIIDPGVTLGITNFKVTVLGEVARPGSFTIPNERITVLEALGLAGDLTINGVRNNVMVLREINGEKSFHRIDLTSSSSVTSPAYYLMQNDVVYVEPNRAQINSSTYSRNTSVIISVAGLIITVISVLTR